MYVEVVELVTLPGLNIQNFEKAIDALLQEFSVTNEVTCILTDDNHVHQLNRDYRNKDMPTDVLSFEMRDAIQPTSPLGEVYISVERAEAQAQQGGHSTNREILHLAIHGTLHLLGYEHETESGFKAMRAKENHYLAEYDT